MMNLRYKSVCHKISCKPYVASKRRFNILSIDGGGIRAFLALVILFEMEIRFKKNICAMFDMVGGTGFGGLIAAALNTSSLVNKDKPKYSVSELMNFFNRRQRDIFQKEFRLATVYSSLDKVHRKIGEKRGFLYDGNGLQESIKELFTPFRKMKDLMKPTILTAHVFEQESNKPIVISSKNKKFQEWNISEAILASTSSPYFFRPMSFASGPKGSDEGT